MTQIIQYGVHRLHGAFRHSLQVIAAFLMLPAYCSAQSDLPPIIGDSLWTYTKTVDVNVPNTHLNDGDWGPWHALAEDGNLIFRIHWTDISVHDASSGKFVEDVGVRELLKNIKAKPRRVYSNRWGNRLVIQYLIPNYRGIDSLVTALVSYPDRKVLKEIQFALDKPYFREAVSGISLDGRWIVAPSFLESPYVLYDSHRDTSFALPFGRGSTWSSDSAGHLLSFGNTIIDLTTPVPTIDTLRIAQEPIKAWNSQLSADGRFIIAAAPKVVGLWVKPQVIVFDCSTNKVVWEINGGWDWRGGGGHFRDDLVSYALSGDGKLAYVYRNDTINGTVIDEGFFYRLPDTIPIARSKQHTTYGYHPWAVTSPHYGYTVFTRDLTRCYTAPLYPTSSAYPCWMLGMRFNELLTYSTAPESAGGTNLALYPNPTNGSVTLPWQWPDTTVYWQLLTTTGQIVTYGSSHVTQDRVSIDLSQELASGRYTLLVRDATAGHVVHQTVIKN